MTLDIVLWNSSAGGPDDFRDRVLERGVVILRDGNCSRDNFIRFSDIVGSEFVSVEEEGGKGRIGGGYSGRDAVDGIQSLFSVTGKGFSHGVPLHGELYFQQSDPPHLLWFYCRKPSRHGGQTLFCDGEALYAALPRSIQQRFYGSNLVYRRRMDADVWPMHFGTADPELAAARCEARDTRIFFNDDGSITTEFKGPAIRIRRGRPVFINNLLPFALRELRTPDETRASVRLETGSVIPAAEILEIERIAESLTMEVEWQEGDIAVVDNTRVLHGRNPVIDPDREIHVRISNADFISDFLEGRAA